MSGREEDLRHSLHELLKPTEGKIRYLKLKVLILAGGTRVLRELLESKILPKDLSGVLKEKTVSTELKKNKGRFFKSEWELLYPTSGSPCQPESFDITLLVKLLKQDVICGNLIPPTTKFDEPPTNADLSLEADIVRISYYRNFLSHPNEKMEIRDPDVFNDYWTQVKNAILRIVGHNPTSQGSPLVGEWNEAIDDLRTCPLDAKKDQGESSIYQRVQEFSLRCILKLPSVGAWLEGTIYVLNWLYDNPDALANLVECIFPVGISVVRIEFGSIKLQLRARDLFAMEELRKRYDSGQLKKDLEEFIITEELQHLASGEAVEFAVEMDEDEYHQAHQYLCDNQEITKDATKEQEGGEDNLKEENTNERVLPEEEDDDEKTTGRETTPNTPTYGKPAGNIRFGTSNFDGKSSKMTADPFIALLLNLAEELTPEDLEKLKFLCKGVIPGGLLSSINKGRDLFEELVKQGQFSRQNIEGLRNLLAKIHRVDLINNKLYKFIDAYDAGDVKDDPEAKTFGLRVKQADFLTGRDALIEKIAQVYTAGQKPMVAVIAPPGFGKTFVATHVGHAMKDKGYNVIYVSLQQKQSCHLLCCDILKTLDPETPLSNDVIQQTKNLLKSLKDPTLLILDNAEDIQNSSCSEEFKGFVEFLGSRAEKLKIFLGSRKSISTKYFEHESINLHPLNNKESLDLLLAKADGTSLKKHEAERLVIQYAGVPLLIKIAAGLVKNGYSPTKLANDLKERTYDVLNLKENEQMKFLTKSIQVFLDSLQREKLVALVQLSCFPASFTQDIVNKLFFEDDVKCSGMLSSLYASALVQLDGENYSLHPLIQTFCRQEQERMKCKKEGTRAMEKFSYYYFNKLEELHIQFVSKDGCQKALKEFCSSEMNLRQALENALKCNDKEMKGRCIDAFNASINLLGKIMLPSNCLSVYGQLYDEAEKMKDKKRMSECLVSRGFRYMCEVNHGTFSQHAFDDFETALSLWRKNLFKTKQPDTEAYAHCLSKLGLCYIAKGQEEKQNGQTADGKKDEEKGRKLINDAIPIRDRLGDKVLLAASNCDKAIAARLCNNNAQAVEIFGNRCLPVYKEHLGDHPWVASLLNYMSKCYQDLGCLEKAIECTKQSLDIREKILGDHQDTARSYVRRGELFLEQENMEAALEAFRKAASIQDKVLGAHEETNKSYEAIQDILYKLDMNEESQEMRERANSYSTEIERQRQFHKQISTDNRIKANSLSMFPELNTAVVVALVAVLIAVISSCGYVMVYWG